MSVTIPIINTSSDTFQNWVDRTNQCINAVSTACVTVNAAANGAITTGNGWVEGTFGARNLTGNTIHGGTVQTPALLTITSNVAVSGNTLAVGNVSINSTDISVGGVSISQISGLSRFSANTAGLTDQQVHFFDKTVTRGADYTVTVKDLNANAYQISKFLLVQDTGNTYSTEYSVLFSNTALGDLSANANSTHVRVYLTPYIANTYVSGAVVLIGV